MKFTILAAATALAAAASLTANALAATYPGHQYAGQAKIGLPQARAIAMRVLPGAKIVDQELEKESGGSGLRYSFDMKSVKKTYEVGVDAKTGKVLEKSLEGPNSD